MTKKILERVRESHKAIMKQLEINERALESIEINFNKELKRIEAEKQLYKLKCQRYQERYDNLKQKQNKVA